MSIQQATAGNYSSKCELGGDHEFRIIDNYRMDFEYELIPICIKCKHFFREERFGWKIMSGQFLEELDETKFEQ